MDASIGKYTLRVQDSQLIITHEAGISFDLTSQEALGIWSFINMYRSSLEKELATIYRQPSKEEERNTDAYLQSIMFPQEKEPAREH
ncbi:MAG TPA: hypothetical protein VH593_23910 [Ktedonobacteraceae bacterium]|jgi:hypothetical protein